MCFKKNHTLSYFRCFRFENGANTAHPTAVEVTAISTVVVNFEKQGFIYLQNDAVISCDQ